MSRKIEYTTPNNIHVCINRDDGDIVCTIGDEGITYDFIDAVLEPSNNDAIGIRNEPLYVCFKTNDGNMEVFKTDGNKSDKLYTQDDIREEHLSILKDKELVYDISLILDMGGVAYLQYVSSMMYSGYVIVYATYEDNINQNIGSSSFINHNMIEFFSTPNGFIPSIDYSKLNGILYEMEDGRMIRKPLTYSNCYTCTKMDNIKDYSYLILKEDYLSIRKMTESIRIISNTLIDIFERNKNNKNEIQRELKDKGYTVFIQYYMMNIEYVINQIDNIFTNSVIDLMHMLYNVEVK